MWAIGIMLFSFLISISLTFATKENLKRLHAETTREVKKEKDEDYSSSLVE